jgi:hypothetical protein
MVLFFFFFFYLFPLKIFGNGYISTYVVDENELTSTIDGNSNSLDNAKRRGSSFNSYKYAVSHTHQT